MIKRTLQNLTYRQKLFYLFNILFVLLLLVILAISFFFSRIWLNQMISDQTENAKVVTKSFEKAFDDVESVPQAMMRNNHLLGVLAQTNQKDQNVEQLIQNRDELQAEVNSLRYNVQNVKDVYLLNIEKQNQTGFIYDSTNLLAGYSLDQVLKAADQEASGKWFFDEGLNSALYTQKIVKAENLQSEKIGYVVVTLDLSFIHQQLNTGTSLSEGNLFFLDYAGGFYPKQDQISTSLLTELGAKNKSQMSLESVKGTSYLLLKEKARPFNFYFLVTNQQIYKRLMQVLVVLIVWILVILISVFITVHYNLNRLVKPIQKLAGIMADFKGEGDLKKMEELVAGYPDISAKDEVGVLYTSVHNLMASLDELVLKNYQERLLNQQMALGSLQAQIDPHFLYNTLDSINWLALSKGEDEISDMVNSLAFLFRKKLDNKETFDTLASELEVVEAYVQIQKIRFGPRLDFQAEIAPEVLNAKLPRLIIQPLIENSMKYALSKMADVCVIRLKAWQEGNQLKISVTDNGPGFDPSAPAQGSGLGLNNARERLALLYDGAGELEISSEPFKTTRILITIPLSEGGIKDE